VTEPGYLADVRATYDAVAADYAALAEPEMARQPFDRAVLAVFAELVTVAGGGTVADLGCGPGRIAAHLHELGLDVFGVDLSPAMVAIARAAHPLLRFDEGSLADLRVTGLAGVVAWYSIIHTPPAELPAVFEGFHGALAGDGLLLLAFHAGDDKRQLTEAYGHAVSAEAYRFPPDHLADLLRDVGFQMVAQLVREPHDGERSQNAYLIARR
jgi:SAM-dependent methyltransferase